MSWLLTFLLNLIWLRLHLYRIPKLGEAFERERVVNVGEALRSGILSSESWDSGDMVTRNSPDWLPTGWIVQFKVQKTGRKIRFYTNLESGKKFFSKDEVIHYTKVSSSKGRKSQPTNRNTKRHSRNNSKPLVVKTNEHPEWLPKGWNVEVRTRNSGPKIGAKYKCYLDPLTGCKFYSKPQVFEYLKAVKLGSRTPIKRKPDIGLPLVVVEKCMVEDLPAGWIKEIKITKNALGIRRDPYYMDPRSGYKFRSKKDVFRYLETGEISRNAFKPKESCINNEELINGEISDLVMKKMIGSGSLRDGFYYLDS